MLVQKRSYSAAKPNVLFTVASRLVATGMVGGTRVAKLRETLRYHPTEDAPQKLLSRGKKAFLQSAREKTACEHDPWDSPDHSGHHSGRRVVFLRQPGSGLLLVTDLLPSTKFTCAEHTRSPSSPPLGKLISARLKSPDT